MKKINKKYIIVLLILVISVGFAYLSTNLSIVGVTNVKGNTWDIHFENVQVLHSVDGNPTPTISSDKATINYTANLNVPGDYFEFTVDVVNAGTVDAMIEDIVTKINDTDISNMPSYLDFSILYSNGVAILDNQLLEHGKSLSLKVKVEFLYDIELEDLPESNITHNFTTSLKYKQADDNAVIVEKAFYTVNFLNNTMYFGQAIPNGTPLFNTYKEALNSFDNIFFFKVVLDDNDKIKRAFLGFEYNNKDYYLEADDDPEIYENNKRIATELFGSDCYQSSEGTFLCSPVNLDMYFTINDSGYLHGYSNSYNYYVRNLSGYDEIYCNDD